MLDPPVLAALRIGLYELFFSAGQRRSRRRSTRRSSSPARRGAAHATGFVNAVMRRAAARARRAGRAAEAGRRSRAGGGGALGAPLAGRDVVARARRRGGPLAAAGLQRAGGAGDAGQHASLGPSRGARAARRGRSRGRRASRRSGRSRRRSRSSSRAAWRGALAMVEAGELTPQSRASAAVVEVLDPQPGESVFDLCAGPGIKTGQIAARMEDRGEVICVERDPGRAEEVAAQARRLGLRSVTRAGDRRRPSSIWAASSTGSWSMPPARTWGRSPRGPTRAGESPPRGSSGSAAIQDAILRARGRRGAPRRGPRLLDLHDLPRRERGPGRVAARIRAGTAFAPLRRGPRSAAPRGSASPLDPRFLQTRPDRDRTSGFFIARLNRDD